MTDRCAVCSMECNKSCGNCRKVSYCTVEHQKSHRRKHKEECFPAVEKENEEFGRFFVATRDIKPQEIMWTEKPAMVAPDGASAAPPKIFPMCLGCCVILAGNFQDGTLPTCSVCHWPLCSSFCKDLFWHKQFECSVFKQCKLKPMDVEPSPLFYEGISVLRMLILKRTNLDAWEKLISLRSQIEIMKKNPRFFKSISSYLTNFIRNLCKMDEDPEVIAKLFGIITRNCVQSTDSQLKTPGKHHRSIIFERKSKMLHSCQPNTVTVSKNDRTTQKLYATVTIKSGEILFDSLKYDDTKMEFSGHVERRIDLYENFQFWCKCSLCINPTEQGTFYSAIKCNKEIDGKPCQGYFLPCIVAEPKTRCEVLKGKWQCNFQECKAEEKYSHLSKIIERIQYEIDSIGTKDAVEKKLKLISKHENITVHENHFLLAKLRFSLLPMLLHNFGQKASNPNRNEEECETASERLITCAQMCLKIADKFHPGYNLLRGVILFFIVGEHEFRLRFKFGNAQRNPGMDRIRDEASAILKIANIGSYPNTLYAQLLTEISHLMIVHNGGFASLSLVD